MKMRLVDSRPAMMRAIEQSPCLPLFARSDEQRCERSRAFGRGLFARRPLLASGWRDSSEGHGLCLFARKASASKGIGGALIVCSQGAGENESALFLWIVAPISSSYAFALIRPFALKARWKCAHGQVRSSQAHPTPCPQSFQDQSRKMPSPTKHIVGHFSLAFATLRSERFLSGRIGVVSA